MKDAIFAALMFLFACRTAAAQGPDALQQAPDFELPYATKDSVARTPLRLSTLIGSANIVLAFYPADWSPGCTREACTFRDAFAGFDSLQAIVLGISGDYVWSHHAWAQHHNLPFRLLSDHRLEVARLYSSYNEKSDQARRTVFVVDKKGRIAYRDLEYSVADESDFQRLRQVLEALR
ncbi:MAG: peroxiredoxin [Bacteroidia bacterium]|nr:MAG: peroxiredoxin [Bacteroidia bacterium]